MVKTIVQFKNVSFRYHSEAPWVLRNISFEVKQGEWIGMIGHNGSGKSTIAKLMNGLLFPNEGEILINGKPVNEETVWAVREDVGMVFQNPDNQFVGTTVVDDIAFGMENRGFPREYMLKQIDKTLLAVGMEQYRMTEPFRLSGGQKQRVAIASVLAISPEILILDEATAMLDPKGRRDILKTVSSVKAEHDLSLITITHHLEEVTKADRLIVLNEGEIWSEGKPRDVFKKKNDLRHIGLGVPFVNDLKEDLEKQGIPFNREPLSEKELLDDLWIYHSKK